MGAGLDTDPTEILDPGAGNKAVNENIIAAIETVFGSISPKGKLPVSIPNVRENEDGTLKYGEDSKSWEMDPAAIEDAAPEQVADENIYNLKLKNLKANENGMYKTEDLMERLNEAISAYDWLQEAYELQEAA